jgi:oxidoreductase
MNKEIENLRFLVFGASGATGMAVVRELLGKEEEDRVGRVYAVARRSLGSFDDPRLKEIIVESLDQLQSAPELEDQLRGNVDVAVCCLGTTRGTAGSAKAFVRVDREYVGMAAKFSKTVGSRSFGLISAQGANKNLWANDWKLFHGLLYSRTKGEAEALVLEQEFPYTAILRPGLLERPNARLVERIGAYILPSVAVERVAKTAINACTSGLRESKGAEARAGPEVDILEMKEIMRHE